MTIHSHNNPVRVRPEECTRPGIGSLLPEYIVNLLEESAAEQVERHLAECQSCRERYVTVLKLRRAARQKRIESVLGKRPTVQRTDRRRSARKKIIERVHTNGNAPLPDADAPDAVDVRNSRHDPGTVNGHDHGTVNGRSTRDDSFHG